MRATPFTYWRRRITLGAVATAIVLTLVPILDEPAGADPANPGPCTIEWDGDAGTHEWTDAANWAGDRLPGADDVACVRASVAGNEGVRVSAGENVVAAFASDTWLHVDGGDLHLAGLSQSLGVEVGGGLLEVAWSLDAQDATQTGGTIAGEGAFRVTGMFRWEGGEQVGPGWTGVFPAPDGGLDGLLLDTGATRVLTGRTLEAAAGMSWTGGGTVDLDPDSVLHLLAPSGVTGPPAQIVGDGELQVDAQLDVVDGSLDSEAFLRSGDDLFIEVHGDGSKLALAGGGSHHASYHVEPGGILDLRGGVHDFGEDTNVTTFSGPVDGAVVVEGEAEVAMAGRYEVAATTVLGGHLALGADDQAGELVLFGGQLEVDATVTAGSFQQDGGELLGEGVLQVEGDATWAGGVQGGSGTTEIEGHLDVAGAGDRAITERDVHAGTISLDDGVRITIGDDAGVLHATGELTVAAGTAEILGAGAVYAGDTDLGDGATFHVAPTFPTVQDAGVTLGEGAFLDLLGGGSHGGTFALGEGSQVNLGGDTRFDATSSLVGHGSIGTYDTASVTFAGRIETTDLNNAGAIDFVGGGSTAFDAGIVNHGDIRIADGVAVASGNRFASMSDGASLVLQGEQAFLGVGPGGLVDVVDGSIEGTGVIAGDVRNDGAVGSGGDIHGAGLLVDGEYRQTAAGVLVVGVDGDAHSTLAVTGRSTLAGILAIGVQGAAPTRAFRVLEGAVTGEFDSLIGIDGACARIEYDEEGVVVVPQPCVTVGSSTVGEDDGAITFHVGLTDPGVEDVTVDFATVDGTATAGADFAARTGSVTIPAGETEGEITVVLVDDDEEEPEEQFTIAVSARGAQLASSSTATGTILDDDREEDELELPIGAIATEGDFDTPSAINATHVVGVSGFARSDETAGWAYGFVSDTFAYLPGMEAAYDLNDADHLVGLCTTGPCFRADRVNHPVRGGSPGALDDDDVLVGAMPGDIPGTTRAAIWATPEASPAALPALPGTSSNAVDIGDDGTVLGVSTTSTQMTAWVVVDGNAVEIPRLDDLAIMDPRAINDLGVAVGVASNLDRTINRAWLWSEATGLVDLGDGAARGINNRDEVVGASLEGHGLLWRHASEGRDPIELTDVITDASWVVGRADLINDDGVIVAQATRGGGTEVVVLGAAAVDGCDVCIELEPQSARYPDPEGWGPTGAQVVEGNPARVHVAVENTDDEVRTATVEIRVDDQLVGEPETITLQPGEATAIDRPWDLTGAAWVGDQPAPAQAITATLLDEEGHEDRTLATEVLVVPRPVVLVHGMNSDASTWAAYPAMLEAAHPGWTAHAIDTMDTKPWIPNTIAENAVLLAQYVDGVQVSANAWQVDVVAHSMGGLITRRYIDASMPAPGGRDALAHLVMLGTPNGGSPCADLFTIPATYELRTDVVARFNQAHPDTLGVPASVAVGVHTPFTCDSPVTGDDVVPVESARTGFTDTQLFEIAHTDMTASAVLFRQFVLPRLTGSAAGTNPAARGSAATAAAVPVTPAAPTPQLLTRDTLALGPGQSFRIQLDAAAGLTGLGATAFGPTVRLAVERGGEVVATAEAGADPFRTASVPTPSSGRHVVVVTNTGGDAVEVPVVTWITGAATRLEATATQEGPLGAIRITARLTGVPLAAPPFAFVAEVTGPDGQVRSDRMVAGTDGSWSLVVDDLRAGGYGIAVRSEDGAFRRTTTTSVEVSLGEDTPGNDAPTAHPVAVAAGRDATTSFRLLGTDPDGDDLTFEVLTQPAHGRVGGAAPFLQYVPARGYQGPDAFTFVVRDGQATSAPATVSIDVGPSPTAITYTRPFPAEGDLGATVQIGANVLGPLLDGPTGGVMTFTLGDQVVTATTDRGSASAAIVLTQPGRQRITIDFAGTAEYAPATFSRFFDVRGGTAPEPTFDSDRLEGGAIVAEAGYPVRVLVRGGDAEANELRYEIDFTDDGTVDATVEKATGIPQHQRRSAAFDHTYPAAFTGRLRVRVTDTAGLVGEATLPVAVASHRPLGDLARLVDGAGEAIDGLEVGADGRFVLYQATDGSDDLDIPTPLGILDRTDGTSRVVSILPDGTVFRFPFAGTMSADGSTAAFTTPAGTDGPPASSQVYVRRVAEGRTVNASVSPTGALADGTSTPEGISADGRYVLFSSRARNLVPAATTGLQLYLRDLGAGTTTLVSVDADGHAIGTGHDAALSADGGVAVFQQGSAVRVWTAAGGVAERLPVGPGGADPDASGDGAAEYFDVSADGRYVVFGSDAEDLSPDDGNGAPDVFVHDRATGVTTLVSAAPDGDAGSGLSGFGAIDDCGTRVAFTSGAPDLVAGDTNGVADVFVRDLVAGTTRRVSVEDRDGVEGDRESSPSPLLSGDGRVVAFDSDATNLVPGDVNGLRDLFALDLGAASTCGGDPGPGEPTTTTSSTTTSTTAPPATTTSTTARPTTTTSTTAPPATTSTTSPPATTTSTTARPTTTTSTAPPATTTSTTAPPATTSTTAPPATTTSTTDAPEVTTTTAPEPEPEPEPEPGEEPSASTTALPSTTAQPPTSSTEPPPPGTAPTLPPVVAGEVVTAGGVGGGQAGGAGLPRTGSESVPLGRLAALLLVGGAALLVLGGRQRRQQHR